MRSAYINRRSIAQRARRDAEAEAKTIRQGPPQMPHGAVIGRIVIEYHGQRVEVELLQAGERCRSHGVRIDGAMEPTMMGLYAAAAKATTRLARMPSRRSDFWD